MADVASVDVIVSQQLAGPASAAVQGNRKRSASVRKHVEFATSLLLALATVGLLLETASLATITQRLAQLTEADHRLVMADELLAPQIESDTVSPGDPLVYVHSNADHQQRLNLTCFAQGKLPDSTVELPQLLRVVMSGAPLGRRDRLPLHVNDCAPLQETKTPPNFVGVGVSYESVPLTNAGESADRKHALVVFRFSEKTGRYETFLQTDSDSGDPSAGAAKALTPGQLATLVAFEARLQAQPITSGTPAPLDGAVSAVLSSPGRDRPTAAFRATP